MLGPSVDLQDLGQEVFLRFFCKIRDLRKLESLRSFVVTIAVRRAQEEIKRRRVRRSLAPFLAEITLRAETTEMDAEAREAIVRLLHTVAQLSADDRNIYWLRRVAGLEHSEIAARVGWSISSVRRRLERLSKRVTSLMSSDPVLSPYLARGQAEKLRAG
jgi:RNA polymerase sigma factor (sigma-70 family)